MSTGIVLAPLEGTWTGTNRLWFMPTDPAFESSATAVVEPVAQGQATLLRYTWSHEGRPQSGVMVILHKATSPEEDAVTWLDSFHTARAFMHFRGGLTPGGALSVLGSYAAPEGPPWGWRITIERPDSGSWALRMYNIEPEGEEMLAVEAVYQRAGEA